MDRRRGRKRNGRGCRNTDEKYDPNRIKTPRFPKHLKGKEIGLYYAEKSKNEGTKQRKEREKSEIGKPLGTIILSESRKKEIRSLLRKVQGVGFSACQSYLSGSVEESDFKKEFHNFITSSFEQKLSDKISKKTLCASGFLDNRYYTEFQKKTTDIKYKEMLAKRQTLPCYSMRSEIVELIKSNQIVVICGETGCGKTTQIPQYILDNFILSKSGSICKIMCTQPRRISAISVAERVADERAEKCGAISVGYHIRLEKKLPRGSGSITYCTTGVILKLMEHNPSLISISHLVLDEIHERDITSDFVIALMKMLTTRRPDLKLILMSATLNAEKFSKYFGNCPILTIPGFTHPVQVYYLEDALARTKYDFPPFKEEKGWRRHLKRQKLKLQETDAFFELVGPYVRNILGKKKYSTQVCNNILNPNSENIDSKFIVALLQYICTSTDDDGSILVFIPGFFDIHRISTCIKDSRSFPSKKYLILYLHSKLPSIEQRKVFEKPPQGMRKIVISTNIAETSITIDDIIYVIDCGKIKMSSYDVEEDLEALRNEWVTLANANQRKGRAGRVQPGVCYHLLSRPRFFNLQSFPTPEVQRCRLESIILTLKIMQLGPAETFLYRLMDPPEPKAIENAVRLLRQMNALDARECLTPLGYHLAKLPVHPKMGKMILMGALFSCLDPILSIAASLEFKDSSHYPMDKQQAVNERKKNLLSGWKSDHLILAEAIRQFEVSQSTGRDYEFCRDFFLSRHTLELLCKMKEQLADYLYEMRFLTNKGVKSREWNQNSKNLSLIKAVVCAGLYPNVAIIRKVNRRGIKVVKTTECEKVVISNNSVNSLEVSFESPLLVYFGKQKLLAINLFDTSMVHPLPLLFFGDEINIECVKTEFPEDGQVSEDAIISLSNILRFKCKESTAKLIKELRGKLDDLLAYKITNPGCVSWLNDKDNPEVKVMRAIMELITSEDLGEIDIETED